MEILNDITNVRYFVAYVVWRNQAEGISQGQSQVMLFFLRMLKCMPEDSSSIALGGDFLMEIEDFVQ